MDYLDFFNRYIMGSVQMFAGFYFYIKFLKKRIRPIYYLLFPVLEIAITAKVGTGNIAEFIVYVLLLTICGFLICKIHNRTLTIESAFRFYGISVVLYAVITALIMQFMFGIFHSVLCILYPLTKVFNQETVGIIFMLLGYLALPATIICYHMTDKFFLCDETANSKYTLMILTPTLMIFLISVYIKYAIYGNAIITDNRMTIMNANHYQMLAIQFLGIASLFCIMFSYKKLVENFHLNTRLSLLEQEEYFLSQYVTEAKTRYEKTKSFRHDIKNHITVLQKLLQDGKSEQAAGYIEDMEEMAGELSFPYSTNNPIADILIGNKLGIAENMGIDVSCSLVLPYPCSICDIDFAIILSNALDNAVNACKSMDSGSGKYIHVAGKIQGDFILIKIENSCQKKKIFPKGTGLLNIQTVAEKYHGAVNIKEQDNFFLLSVLLIIPQHSESIPQQLG